MTAIKVGALTVDDDEVTGIRVTVGTRQRRQLVRYVTGTAELDEAIAAVRQLVEHDGDDVSSYGAAPWVVLPAASETARVEPGGPSSGGGG